jgi:hypothetical protein
LIQLCDPTPGTILVVNIAGVRGKPMRIPLWKTIRGVGSSKAVNSANIWAIIVPIAAKFLDKVQEVVSIELFGHNFQLTLKLPFSWEVLFFASFSFLIANVLYAVYCPTLIKETGSFKDFSEQKRSGNELLEILRPVGESTEQNQSPKYVSEFNWLNTRHVTLAGAINNSSQLPIGHEERAMIEVYAHAIEVVNNGNSWARGFISLFYGIGGLGFTFILFQNAYSVATHFYPALL